MGTIIFEDGSTALTGTMTLTAGTPFVLPMDGTPWCACSKGNAFTIAAGAAVTLSGLIGYTSANF